MNRLRLLRKEIGLTMKEVGERLNLKESTISLYENGKREPDNKTLSALADLYGVSIDYIVGRTNERNGIALEGVYFRIASEAQEAGVPPEDIQKIIELYKKYKR